MKTSMNVLVLCAAVLAIGCSLRSPAPIPEDIRDVAVIDGHHLNLNVHSYGGSKEVWLMPAWVGCNQESVERYGLAKGPRADLRTVDASYQNKVIRVYWCYRQNGEWVKAGFEDENVWQRALRGPAGKYLCEDAETGERHITIRINRHSRATLDKDMLPAGTCTNGKTRNPSATAGGFHHLL